MPASLPGDPLRRVRFFVELRVRFVLLDGSLTGPAFVSSLSLSDLFVETDRPLPIGTMVRMRLYVPGKAAVDLSGVVRRHGEGKMQLGMRIAFLELDDAAVRTLLDYLEKPIETLRAPALPLPPPPTADAILPPAAHWEDDDLTPPGGIVAASDEPPQHGDADAFNLSTSMQGRVVQFLETLDAETGRRLVSGDGGAVSEPGKVPAPFEAVEPALLDPEAMPPEALPLVVGVAAPQEPSEPTDEAARLRQKYNLDDSLFDVEQLKSRYGITEDLFEDEPAAAASAEPARTLPPPPWMSRPIPPWPDAGRRVEPAVERVVASIGKTPEQRLACAAELKTRGEAALKRGLTLKAASELGLAVAFAPEDRALAALYEKVRDQASSIRADDLYRQGLQQAALGEGDAALKLLLSSCELLWDRKPAIAAARILLQRADAGSLRQARALLAEAARRLPDDVDLLYLRGRVAELEGFPKRAIHSWKRALELAPDHGASKDALARLEKGAA